MNMDNDLLTDAAGHLLAQECTAEIVRDIEGGNHDRARALWGHIEDAGFADALVAEEHGGAGLGLAQVAGMLSRCGAHAFPLPLADTLIGRALLARAGHTRQSGTLALARGRLLDDGSVHAVLHGGRVADSALIQVDEAWHVLPLPSSERQAHAFILDCAARWGVGQVNDAGRLRLSLPDGLDLHVLRAPLLAAQMSGAMGAVLERTLEYANDRQQFGRPIGKFQAVQHQLAVMSEHVFAARMAAQLGCVSPTPFPTRLQAAIAKARCNEAARAAIETAHAVHGAIGITDELDLHLLTRRLQAWRQSAGSESYWHTVAGEALLAHPGLTLDLLRSLPGTVH